MADGDFTVAKVLTLEYERLKDEQKTRIGFRDNLVYATLASMAAVIAATLSARGQVNLVLLLPPVALLLGWTYLVNDEKISAAGRYIRTELAPRLAAELPPNTPVFGWESFHRGDQRRRTRKALQLAVDLAMFCLAPAAALVVFWASGSWTVVYMAISVVESLAILGLAMHLVLYADLARHVGEGGAAGESQTCGSAS
jgi:fatty acid desaturase